MKKFKLLALTALLALGTNAFAQTYAYRSINGLIYKYQTDASGKDGSEAAKAYPATIFGLKAAPSDKALTIAASTSFSTDLEETKYITVTGFEENWANAQAAASPAPARVAVGGAIETLSIDATNFANLTNAFTNLTALKSLTISAAPAAWVNTGYVTGPLVTGNAKIQETLTTIDISGLTKATLVSGTSNTFKNLPKLTTITLPTGITEIGVSAFEGLEITSLTIPATLETIGTAAFKKTALTSIDLSGTKVTAIPAWAFESSKITSATLPAELTTIGLGAFYSTPLTSIAIPEKVTSIGNQAFQKCEALTTVTGLAGVTAIGDNTFDAAKVLATLDLSAATELTTIGDNALKGTAITAVIIPNKVTSIGASAFEGCEALASFSVAAAEEEGAEVLTTLGANLFKGCKALTSVDLTNSAITAALGKKIFQGCVALKSVKVPASTTQLCAGLFEDAVIEDLDLSKTAISVLNDIFCGTDKKHYSSLKSIVLPEEGFYGIVNLSSDKKGVFNYCDKLEEIVIPADITADIASYTFYYCTSLKSLTYEPTTTTVADIALDAFLGCTPWVKINTNAFYFDNSTGGYTEPTNATFGNADDLTYTTDIKDAGTSGKYFAKICPKLNIMISKEDLGDVKLYSVYTDEGIAYFQALQPKSGYYRINEGEHVIAKADTEQKIEFELNSTSTTSVLTDDIFSVTEVKETAKVQDGTVTVKNGKGTTLTFTAGTDYIYALTNSAKNNGFGFTYYKGATLPAGAFFIISDLAPTKAARLQTIWLDENGNVENEATAIKSIDNATENAGEIFNLQGVRVKGAQKGIYIQNGKKFIVK